MEWAERGDAVRRCERDLLGSSASSWRWDQRDAEARATRRVAVVALRLRFLQLLDDRLSAPLAGPVDLGLLIGAAAGVFARMRCSETRRDGDGWGILFGC